MTPAKLRPSRTPDVSLNQGLLATPPALGLCKRTGRTWPRAEGWGWGLPPPGAGLRGRGPAVSMASGAYLGGGACAGGGRPCAGWSGRRPGCSRGQPRPGSRPRPPRRPGPAGARGRAAACATGRPPGLGEGPRRGGGVGAHDSGLRAPVPSALPSRRELTGSGDVGRVAGIADIATREGHEAELIENVLGVGVQEGGQGLAPPIPAPFRNTTVARVGWEAEVWGLELGLDRRGEERPCASLHTHLDESWHQQLHFRAGHGPVQHLPALGALPSLQDVAIQRLRDQFRGIPMQEHPPGCPHCHQASGR